MSIIPAGSLFLSNYSNGQIVFTDPDGAVLTGPTVDPFANQLNSFTVTDDGRYGLEADGGPFEYFEARSSQGIITGNTHHVLQPLTLTTDYNTAFWGLDPSRHNAGPFNSDQTLYKVDPTTAAVISTAEITSVSDDDANIGCISPDGSTFYLQTSTDDGQILSAPASGGTASLLLTELGLSQPNYSAPAQMFCLRNGELLVAWTTNATTDDAIVKHYSAAGATLHTYTVSAGGSQIYPNFIVPALDDLSFWISLLDFSVSPSPSTVKNIRISDGTVLHSFDDVDGVFSVYYPFVVVPVAIGAPALALTFPDTTGRVGEPYSAFLVASGGTAPYGPYAITVGTLPGGLTLNASTGEISGTPTTEEIQPFTAQVTDSTGSIAAGSLLMTDIDIGGPCLYATTAGVILTGGTIVAFDVGTALLQATDAGAYCAPTNADIICYDSQMALAGSTPVTVAGITAAGIATDYSIFYGIGHLSGTTFAIYEIDPITGAQTQVGTFLFADTPSLVSVCGVSPDGATLYLSGANSGTDIGTVSTTGTASAIVPLISESPDEISTGGQTSFVMRNGEILAIWRVDGTSDVVTKRYAADGTLLHTYTQYTLDGLALFASEDDLSFCLRLEDQNSPFPGIFKKIRVSDGVELESFSDISGDYAVISPMAVLREPIGSGGDTAECACYIRILAAAGPVDLNADTWVYDATEGQWHQRAGYDAGDDVFTRWRARGVAAVGSKVVVGDFETGDLYILDMDTFTDNDDAIKRLRRTPYLSTENQWLFIDRVELGIQPGVGNIDDPDPQVSLSISRDSGVTYSTPTDTSMGATGDDNAVAIWRALGRSRADRFVMQVTSIAPVRQVWGPGLWIKVRQGTGQR